MVILHILSISIVIRTCHGNLCFRFVTSFFEMKKNLHCFQDNDLIKLKFGREGVFLGPEFKLLRNFMYNNNNSLIATNNQNTMVMCINTTQVQSYE